MVWLQDCLVWVGKTFYDVWQFLGSQGLAGYSLAAGVIYWSGKLEPEGDKQLQIASLIVQFRGFACNPIMEEPCCAFISFTKMSSRGPRLSAQRVIHT